MAKMNWGRVQAEDRARRADYMGYGPPPPDLDVAPEHAYTRVNLDRKKGRNKGPRRCEAKTRAGKRCNGGAMAESKFCGPHQQQRADPSGQQCQATTKRGSRCHGGTMKGSDYCGPHQPVEAR